MQITSFNDLTGRRFVENHTQRAQLEADGQHERVWILRCITEQVKRLADNEIELGIEIRTIESRASNILMTKGTTYVVMWFDR